jgi:hypothetical protein
LNIIFIPVHIELRKSIFDGFDTIFLISFPVGILDAEDKLTLGMSGHGVGINSRSKIADVHKAGGRGSKTGADHEDIIERESGRVEEQE